MSIEDIEKVISSSSCAYVAAKEIESMLAARDKWWVTQMETNFMGAIGCRLFPDNCDSCSIIERCAALGWQRFKNTLEVK
jgi:hypothetical protein